MRPTNLNSAVPEPGEQALIHCDVCKVLAAPRELHRISLPTINGEGQKISYECTDYPACTARVAHAHRNDALRTSDDPLYAAGNAIDRIRGELTRIADDLAAVQTTVGQFRAQFYQGEPDEAGVGRAARVIAKHFTGSTLSAEDPMFHRVARDAIKAARFDAEEPDVSVDEARKLRELADIIGPGFDRDAGLEMIREARAAGWAASCGDEMDGLATIRAVRRQDEGCLERRYDTRGDCDGPAITTTVVKPNEFGLPASALDGDIILCRAHWRQAYRAGEVYKGLVPGEQR